jgi:ribonuclease BN (tRNA processing enzyme)
VELTVLGACGTYPSAGGACSGYLLRHEGFSLWLDAGHGTLSNLQKHIRSTEVGAVFISHAHPDHFVDLYPFFYSLFAAGGRPEKIPIYGPSMARERVGRIITKRDGKEDFDAVLPWNEFVAGESVDLGPFRMTGFESAHSCTNVAVRIEAGGKVLCYTGDTGTHPALARAAAEADLFLCEASWLEREDSIPEPIHLRAREAGEIATRAGAKRLVLTHIWPHNDMNLVREQAAGAYDGPLELVLGGEQLQV